MSFKDMIKRSVLEGFDSSNLATSTIITSLGIAVVLGLYIYFIYRITTKSGFYSRGFNKSLAILPVITAGILLAMQGSLVISLGMVGALSIVRFRNAVKETMDLTFLFWSISMGIVVGAGLYELAIFLSLCITVLVIGLDLIPKLRCPFLLIVSGTNELEEKSFISAVQSLCPQYKIRSRSITQRGTEWIIELRIRNGQEIVGLIAQQQGVLSVNLLSHDGEIRF